MRIEQSALAVTSAMRLPALADIPVMSEFLPGFEANTWSGIGTPKNTPAGIIEKLNQEINAVAAFARQANPSSVLAKEI